MCGFSVRVSIVAVYGCFWDAIPAKALAKLLMELFESEFRCFGVCSTIGKMLPCETCVDWFWCWCDGGLYDITIRPKTNSGN